MWRLATIARQAAFSPSELSATPLPAGFDASAAKPKDMTWREWCDPPSEDEMDVGLRMAVADPTAVLGGMHGGADGLDAGSSVTSIGSASGRGGLSGRRPTGRGPPPPPNLTSRSAKMQFHFFSFQIHGTTGFTGHV